MGMQRGVATGCAGVLCRSISGGEGQANTYCFAGGDWSNVVTIIGNYNNIPPRGAYDRGTIPYK
jgi:hypothetical protein